LTTCSQARKTKERKHPQFQFLLAQKRKNTQNPPLFLSFKEKKANPVLGENEPWKKGEEKTSNQKGTRSSSGRVAGEEADQSGALVREHISEGVGDRNRRVRRRSALCDAVDPPRSLPIRRVPTCDAGLWVGRRWLPVAADRG
jgi:hypothetical protein